MASFQTIVVFDTEATGLPKSPSDENPKMTEICLVAVTKEELDKPGTPRVLNKLSLCFNPERPIQAHAAQMTGLDNQSLSSMPTFSSQSRMIVDFLSNLPQPVGIFSHNGNRFDFPLLRQELDSAGSSLPDSLRCVDTVEVFKTLDQQDRRRVGKKEYTLQNLYRREFGREPESSHGAESDTLAVLDIVKKTWSRFRERCALSNRPITAFDSSCYFRLMY